MGVGKPLWFVGEESSYNAAWAARGGARLHAVLAGASDFVQTPQLQDFTAGCRPVSSCGPRVASVAGAYVPAPMSVDVLTRGVCAAVYASA